MPKMIQIRHVPDALHQRLKQKAAGAGMSLSDYLRREITHIAEYPSWDETVAMLDQLAPVRSDVSSVDLVHEARNERDEELWERVRPRP